MNDRLQELQDDLQILALPVSFQMHLDVGDACRASALTRPFISWNRNNVDLRLNLTPEQAHVLSKLDMTLRHLHGLPDCSETIFRKHAGWRQVRRLARTALIAFGWSLDLPTHDASVYYQVKGKAMYESFTSI